jgi:hydroxyacylglutathione hydrolase
MPYPKKSESILLTCDLTGDTLFRGTVGRLDLEGAGTPEQLYESVKRLFSINGFVAVLPGHFGKTQCGVGLSSVPLSTIGFEKRFNRSIESLSDRSKFVEFMNSPKTM